MATGRRRARSLHRAAVNTRPNGWSGCCARWQSRGRRRHCAPRSTMRDDNPSRSVLLRSPGARAACFPEPEPTLAVHRAGTVAPSTHPCAMLLVTRARCRGMPHVRARGIRAVAAEDVVAVDADVALLRSEKLFIVPYATPASCNGRGSRRRFVKRPRVRRARRVARPLQVARLPLPLRAVAVDARDLFGRQRRSGSGCRVVRAAGLRQAAAQVAPVRSRCPHAEVAGQRCTESVHVRADHVRSERSVSWHDRQRSSGSLARSRFSLGAPAGHEPAMPSWAGRVTSAMRARWAVRADHLGAVVVVRIRVGYAPAVARADRSAGRLSRMDGGGLARS